MKPASTDLHMEKNMHAGFRVLVVDDHPLFREALAARIALLPGVIACREAATAQDVRRLLDRETFSVLVVDLSLGDGTGLELIRRIRADGHSLPVLVVSALEESVYGERAFRAGAQGFINKMEPPARILEALRTVLAGELHLSPALGKAFAISSSKKVGEVSGIGSLSDREVQIFSLLGRGHGTREIAELLFLSPHTVESHRERIRAKLGLRNSMALVQRAVQWSLEENGMLRGEQRGDAALAND